MKFDFNDKDNASNFERRKWVLDMDAEKMVAGLPVKENANYFESSKLIDGLRKGERVSVTLVKDGKEIPVTMEVNPSTRNVDLYNANNKKVGLPDAFGDKKEKAPVVLSPTTEQKQQRRNGMTIRS